MCISIRLTIELHDRHLASVVKSGTMTRVDWINYGVYQSGEHKYIYDEVKAIVLLEESGFGSVPTKAYEEGTDLDEPLRRDFAFYIEAVKSRPLSDSYHLKPRPAADEG
jgi:hypothetical protein